VTSDSTAAVTAGLAAQSAAEPGLPWPAGSATGAGSMPGTDPAEACAVIMGELPDFPYLPELPARGPGADMIGRTAALLIDLPVETTAGGWKFAARPGRDQRRADSFLAFDLDAAQQAAEEYAGPYKIQVCGPLTLAARIESPRSLNPALADPGAVADLVASLAEGLARHVAAVRARIPGATVVLQVDEPALPWVLAGRVPTASGLNTVRALDETGAADALRPVLSATTALAVVHCCAENPPFLLMKEAGAGAVSFDLALLQRADLDAVAEIAEAGLGLLIGALPADAAAIAGSADRPPRSPRETAAAVVGLWRRMTLDSRLLAAQVVLTPACGLAGLPPPAARLALEHCREAARIAPEMIEEAPA
jgi:methionine synthase II (cobalamin-independent)